MKKIILIATLLSASAVHAQVYKCMANGKPTFSDVPCAADAERINVRAAEPTEQDQAAAKARAANDIDELKLRDEREAARKAAAKRRSSTEPTQADICADILAKRDEARYWSQRFKHPDNVLPELAKIKKYDDEHFSKCYGSKNGNY